MIRVWMLIACMVAICSGCVDRPPYSKCLDKRECVNIDGVHGLCLMSPYGPFCAFPDNDCATMWRWHVTAYQSIADECVAPSVSLDAAVGS